jgi:hypothetical protein
LHLAPGVILVSCLLKKGVGFANACMERMDILTNSPLLSFLGRLIDYTYVPFYFFFGIFWDVGDYHWLSLHEGKEMEIGHWELGLNIWNLHGYVHFALLG